MFRNLVLNLFEDMMLLVVSADLLYLYYAGAWTDLNRATLIAELVCLYGFIAFAIWRVYRHIKEV